MRIILLHAMHPLAVALTLVVRLYNSADIPASELISARIAAESIFHDSGLAVTFRQCGRPAPGYLTEPCDTPLEPDEVVVRIISAPAFTANLRPDTYGVAYIVRDTNRGWLATLFSDRVSDAASRVDVDAGTLLGRVLAHEVGHLLLGVDYHSDAGLMAAEWPDAVLQRTRDAWRFSLPEVARMQDVRPTETIPHQ